MDDTEIRDDPKAQEKIQKLREIISNKEDNRSKVIVIQRIREIIGD